METILTSSGERDGTTLFTVWAAVISLCNLHQTCDLIAPVGMVARLAGLGYKATLRALHSLAGMNLLEIEERRVLGKMGREPSLYRVKASTPPCGDKPRGLGSKDTTLVACNPPLSAETYNNSSYEENKGTRERAADAAGKLTPENFSERAQAANADRLTAPQLEAFCDYWLERDPKGRCRFQSEKFFELPRRIATWARRERVAPIPSAAPAAVKPERPIWQDCARRCRHWDSEKRWCSKFVRTEPKSCEHCREF
ncbi:MAG: hypothetical protein ACOX7Q_15450 [Kiritimatiellia bacterium]